MKKLISKVLTIIMLVTILLTAFNMGTVSAASKALTLIPDNGFEVKIGSKQVNIGDNIIVPIDFTNIPTKGIAVCSLTITYDPTKLAFQIPH